MQILLTQHHIGDIILIMVHYINFFNWNLSSINNYSSFVFNVYGGTLSSTYTDTANDTTNSTLLSTNNLLMYNGLKWINSTVSLEMNNVVVVSSLTNKNIIRWNGSNWVNAAD